MNIRRIPMSHYPFGSTGFTLVELTIAMFVFGMIVVLFGAIFPVATRAGHVGGNYAQAALLAQHKVDQIRSAGYAKLDGNSLVNLGVIDSSNGTPQINADGSFSFTLTDNLVDNTKGGIFYTGFFPPGSTGTVLVQDYHAVNATVPATTAKFVTITISWVGGSQGNGTFTTHTLVVLN